jgi:hypothetical protein
VKPGVRIALILTFAALVAPACGGQNSAGAGPEKSEAVATVDLAAGPVLHGEEVVWGEGGLGQQEDIAGGDDAGPLRVLVAWPGKPRRVLYEQRPSQKRPEWSFGDFAGSPRGFAFVRTWLECFAPDYGSCTDDADVAEAARGRPVDLVEPEVGACDFWAHPNHLDVDGTRVALTGGYCVAHCSFCWRIALDDIADQKPPETILQAKSPGFEQLSLAGNFVAARTQDDVVVYDLGEGKVHYRPRPPVAVEPTLQIDLRLDGTLVGVWGLRKSTTVALFTPAQPKGHLLPIHPRRERFDTHAVRLAGDRIAFEQETSDDESELVVAGFDGRAQIVASFDSRHRRVGDFDFDGKRVTWATQEVRDVTSHCWRISEAGHMACSKRYAGPTTIYVARLAEISGFPQNH